MKFVKPVPNREPYTNAAIEARRAEWAEATARLHEEAEVVRRNLDEIVDRISDPKLRTSARRA